MGGGDVLHNLGRNDLAGTAPRSEAVEDNQRVLLVERRLPVGLAVHTLSLVYIHACLYPPFAAHDVVNRDTPPSTQIDRTPLTKQGCAHPPYSHSSCWCMKKTSG